MTEKKPARKRSPRTPPSRAGAVGHQTSDSRPGGALPGVFPIVGIGANEKEAFAPRIIERAGLRIAVLGASQVSEQTLAQFSAGPSSGGITWTPSW